MYVVSDLKGYLNICLNTASEEGISKSKKRDNNKKLNMTLEVIQKWFSCER